MATYKLVITEKPSVGMNIAAVLGARDRKDGYIEGNGYIVSWCVGHLVGLADAYEYNEKYGKWRRGDLPIVPENWKYVIFEDKRKQFNVLRRLMNRPDVENLIAATDAGREGELIFRFVYHMAGCTKPFSRLWISSMEESAIKKGFAALRDGRDFDPLFQSALCRAKADWLIGINMTRLYSVLYDRTLNVGRVQSPTLAMLTGRAEKISGFVKEKYHHVHISAGGIDAISGKIPAAEEAKAVQTACHNRRAVCVSVKKERKNVAPPKLFDLTALQRESNRLFGYTAKQTLDAAQKLYERKLITYPRTDSRYLTSDMAAGIPALVKTAASFIATGALVTVNAAQLINDAYVSDHHAIIPTAGIATADRSKFTDTERGILSLVAASLVNAVGSKHVYEAITAVFDCNGHNFTARGNVTVDEGWKAFDKYFLETLKLNETHTRADSGALPPIADGQVFEHITATVTEHFTQPPNPYTEDTLLAAMESAGAADTPDGAERRGLGTPATRAAVIEKLVSSGFMTRKGRQLIPTADGGNLIKLLPDALKSPALTARWESALTKIARGEAAPEDFMRGIEDMTRALVTENTAPDAALKGKFTPPKRAAEKRARPRNMVTKR